MTKSVIKIPIRRLAFVTTILAGCSFCSVSTANEALYQDPNNFLPPVPTSYPDDPACKVKSVQKAPSVFEDPLVSAAIGLSVATQLDANGIYQLYVGGADGRNFKCITCTPVPGGPPVNRNKTAMISFHPSGRWLFVGVEENTHDLMWLPEAWQRGFLNSGIWLNMWITTPTGDRWYQITNFNPSSGNPANGFAGTAFTPDGKKAVWAEFVDGNIFANAFGIWKLYIADFVVDAKGTPSLINKRDITPAGARWVEPATFSPDGRHILLSTDIGLANAQGQDQWSLDVFTGKLKQLTNTPTVWDEHGVYSPDGRKIVWMSSYPYRNDPDSYKVLSLHTEFMLMNTDGSHLQQLTHFNLPGYPESEGRTVAAVAYFTQDGTRLIANVMAHDGSFGGEGWSITFAGPCGNIRGARAAR